MRWIADIVALVVVFVVPLVAFKTVASVLSDHVSEGGFGLIDRLAGMAFGVVRGAAIVCALYLGIGILVEPEQQPSWITQAALLPYVQEGAGMLQDLLPAHAEEAGRDALREAQRRSCASSPRHDGAMRAHETAESMSIASRRGTTTSRARSAACSASSTTARPRH